MLVRFFSLSDRCFFLIFNSKSTSSSLSRPISLKKYQLKARIPRTWNPNLIIARILKANMISDSSSDIVIDFPSEVGRCKDFEKIPEGSSSAKKAAVAQPFKEELN